MRLFSRDMAGLGVRAREREGDLAGPGETRWAVEDAGSGPRLGVEKEDWGG